MTDRVERITNARPVIQIEDLRFRWPGRREDVLHIERFEIVEGEAVFIHGASGSGKSTLLSLLAGIVTPSSGAVRVLGTALGTLGHVARDEFRAAHIGIVFQLFNLIPYLSLVENVVLPCLFSKARRAKVLAAGRSPNEVAVQILSRLGLEAEARDAMPVTELSVGQQQRVAVARALIGGPEILIADEPTSSLDADLRASFMELLFEACRASGMTLVFVSHDTSLRTRFDRAVAMSDMNRIGSRARGGN